MANTGPEKDAEAANNVEAASVDLSEATIKNIKVRDLKGELKSRRILQMGRKAELQDKLIHAIKYKVPIAGVVENTKISMEDLRMRDLSMRYLRKTPTNCQENNSQRQHTGNH